MLPLTKILCPIDFSEPSYQALEVANELALHFSAELILAHAVQPLPVMMGADPAAGMAASGFDVSGYEKWRDDSAAELLTQAVQERVSEDVDQQTALLTGRAAEEIVALADRQKVDLIVIATHGRSGWRRVVFGSVAESVVRTASCAVLTI